MKRILAALLCLALLPSLPAVGTPLESGDYRYELTAEGTAILTRWLDTAADLEIPGALDGHTVTGIGEEAFRDSPGLQRVRIPEGVTAVGPLAFYNCAALTDLTLPLSLREIGDLAFAYCSSLKHVWILEGAERIGEFAFGDCPELHSVTVPLSVTEIGPDAFFGMHAGSMSGIFGHEGSYAQVYAQANGIPFFPLVQENEATAETRPEASPAPVAEDMPAESAAPASVVTAEITIYFPGLERTGTYSGAALNGLPHGQGSFTAVNDEGVRWTYTGEWSEGAMQGDGAAVWEDGWEERGRYERNVLVRGQALYHGTVVYDGGFTWDSAAQDELYHGDGKLYNALGRLIYEGGFLSGRLAESAEPRALRAETLRAQCAPLKAGDHGAILRDEAGWLGRLVRFDGDISYVWEGDFFGYGEFEICLDSDDARPLDVYYRYSEGERVLGLDENVTVLGAVTGVYRYEDSDGTAHAMPLLEAELILRADGQDAFAPSGPEAPPPETLSGLWMVTTTYVSWHGTDGIEKAWDHTWSVPVRLELGADGRGTWTELHEWGELAGSASYQHGAISASLYGNGPVEYRGEASMSGDGAAMSGSMTEESRTDAPMWTKGHWSAVRFAQAADLGQYRELREGDTGKDVAALKKRLFELGYFRTDPGTDSFTERTAEAVLEFEKANGLPADGIAGPLMQALFFSEQAKPKP